MEQDIIPFVYNIRHKYKNLNDPRRQIEADFDDKSTIGAITEHFIEVFRPRGYKILLVEANEEAYLKLYRHKNRIFIVFNYAEGLYGRNREAHIPAMCEMLQLPYTGSDAQTQADVLNKIKTKDMLLNAGIPTLPYELFNSPNGVLKTSLEFPLIVKPVYQGSSAGILESSVVHNNEELTEQVDYNYRKFSGQPSYAERLLTGREFTVALLGNGPNVRVFPIIEEILPKGSIIRSFRVKWDIEEDPELKNMPEMQGRLICPANIDKSLERKINEMCIVAWHELGMFDWGRADVRCDEENNPYILEFNSPAGILPPEISMYSAFPEASRRAGYDFNSMLLKIVSTAAERNGLVINESAA